MTTTDEDFANWRAQLNWWLKRRAGSPTVDDYTPEAVHYSYIERCDTPEQAAHWLNV